MSACFQLAQVQLHINMSAVKLAPKTQIKQYQQGLPSAHSSLDYLVLFAQEHNSTCTLWPGCIPWAIPLGQGQHCGDGFSSQQQLNLLSSEK